MKLRTVVVQFELETFNSAQAIKWAIKDTWEDAKQITVNVIDATKPKKKKVKKACR